MNLKQFLKPGLKKLLLFILLIFVSYFAILLLQENPRFYEILAGSFIIPLIIIFPAGKNLVLFFSVLYLYLLSCLIVSTLDTLCAWIRINKFRIGVNTAKVQTLLEYLNNSTGNIRAYINLDKIKEFFKPNRWKLLITIILSIPLIIFILIYPTITESYYTMCLIFLVLVTSFPSYWVLEYLSWNDMGNIKYSMVPIISYYSWSCIYFSIYKIATKKERTKIEITILFLFFLILSIIFYKSFELVSFIFEPIIW